MHCLHSGICICICIGISHLKLCLVYIQILHLATIWLCPFLHLVLVMVLMVVVMTRMIMMVVMAMRITSPRNSSSSFSSCSAVTFPSSAYSPILFAGRAHTGDPFRYKLGSCKWKSHYDQKICRQDSVSKLLIWLIWSITKKTISNYVVPKLEYMLFSTSLLLAHMLLGYGSKSCDLVTQSPKPAVSRWQAVQCKTLLSRLQNNSRTVAKEGYILCLHLCSVLLPKY